VNRDRRAQRTVVNDVGIGNWADHRDRHVEPLRQQRLEVDDIRVAVGVNLPSCSSGRTMSTERVLCHRVWARKGDAQWFFLLLFPPHPAETSKKKEKKKDPPPSNSKRYII